MDVAERETQVRSFVEEVWNGRNYEAAVALYSERRPMAYLGRGTCGNAIREAPSEQDRLFIRPPISIASR
jgi:hypothetical protein